MLTLRACLQGTFGSGEGLQLTATIDRAEVSAPLFVGWTYSDSNDEDDTITDAASASQSCVQDGGWVDFTWAVPDGELTALTIAPALNAEEETQGHSALGGHFRGQDGAHLRGWFVSALHALTALRTTRESAIVGADQPTLDLLRNPRITTL